MKRFLLALALVALSAVTAQAAYVMPYDQKKTMKTLDSIGNQTLSTVDINDPKAIALWYSMYVDCAVFGMKDRYIYFDTLFRISLLQAEAYGQKDTYIDVEPTASGITVDSVSPPNKVHSAPVSVRMAVIDWSGQFEYSIFPVDGLRNACAGAQGPIFWEDPNFKSKQEGD